MNVAIKRVNSGDLARGDTPHNDGHTDFNTDHILANPFLNFSDWRGARLHDDKRWQYGVPPTANANFGWVQAA